MTTLRTEKNHGDLERRDMTTAQNPGCTCGAAEFGPDVPHKEVCYISLAKDAEAVTDAPVRDLGGTGRRQAVNDPGPETEFCKIRFVPGLPTPNVEAYNPDGKPSIIQAGAIAGKLIGVRDMDTNYGPGTAFDLEIQSDNPELNGVVAGSFASSMLKRMIQQVRIGSNIEIVRIPSVERWHVYEVYVLD